MMTNADRLPRETAEARQRGMTLDSADHPQHPAAAMTRSTSTLVRRRDILQVATISLAVTDSAATLLPLPALAETPKPVTVTIDLAKIASGSGIRVASRGQPVFVRSLTPQEIQAADAVPLSSLRDPATLADRTKPGHSNWLVTYAICTHLGCMPLGIIPQENRGSYGGYYCTCHGSQYDTAGRVGSGPAPSNLEIPDYCFRSPSVIEIGG